MRSLCLEAKWSFTPVRSYPITDHTCHIKPAGLIRLMKNVDELAAVLAHEVAHVVARHSVIAFYRGAEALTLFTCASRQNVSQSLAS